MSRTREAQLSVALIALPYDRDTNPAFAKIPRMRIAEVLADQGATGR